MGTDSRVIEKGADLILEAGGHGGLQAAFLGQVAVQCAGQQHLCQTAAPHHRRGLGSSPLGESDVAVGEGEKAVRRGTVLLLRGAAATVGSADLAALAKGRRPNIGQVLVRLDATPEDIETCPIGHAASVDFPDVGIVDIIRARLRL